MGARRSFLILSLVAVIASLAVAVLWGPKLGIDFAGGTEIQVAFKQEAGSADIRKTLDSMGFPASEVVTFGTGDSEYLIRLQAISAVTKETTDAARAAVTEKFSEREIQRFEISPGGDKLTLRISGEVPIGALEAVVGGTGLSLGEKIADEAQPQTPEGDEVGARTKKCVSSTCTWPFQDVRVYEVNLKGVSDRVMTGLREQPWGAGAIKMRSEWVGPKVGKQLRGAAFWSLIYALAFIMLYIAIRFDVRFAPGAVVALIHDIIITIGIFTIARVEVSLATVAALLTIVGYSLNDTIVIFDRIRENLSKLRERDMLQVINISINETLSRTILTSITTLIAVVTILIIAWNTTIRDFAFALLVGVIVGTYSSVFIASPVVGWLDKRFAKKKA